jgi:hypothetical protein
MHSLRLVTIFAWHVLAACVLFAAICIGALALALFTRWLATAGAPSYVTEAGALLEYFVFIVDVICFITFVLREAITLIHQIIWPTAARRDDD